MDDENGPLGASDPDTPESEPEHSEEVTGGSPDEAPEEEPGPLSDLSDEELDRLLQQYIHYGETAIETSRLRILNNRVYGILLTSILAGLFALSQGTLTITSASAVLFASVFGVLVSYFWLQSLASYRRLNKARYKIMNEIESVLPAKLYLDEWRFLKREKPNPELIEPRLEDDPDHRSHTIVELWFVRLLGVGYVVVGGYTLGFISIPFLLGALDAPVVSPTFGGLVLGGVLFAVSAFFFGWRHRSR